MSQVDYYLTLGSPYTYLGHDRFVEITKRHNAQVNLKLVNMGPIFSETGGLPLAKRAPARQAYRFQELKRWRNHLDLPLNLEPEFFPVNDRAAAGMVIVAQNNIDLAGAFLRAVWAEERNIADPDTIVSIANDMGLEGSELFAKTDSPEVTKVWEANTRDAMEIGVFGAPTYAIGEQLFWGQDRLEFLEKSLISNAGN